MLLTISIALEVAIAVIAVLAALKGRPYLYGLAFTFAVYVLYDLGRLLGWHAEGGILSVLFLLASASALYAVWSLYNPNCRKGGGGDIRAYVTSAYHLYGHAGVCHPDASRDPRCWP
jgi:hypothetical protein